MKVRPSGRIAMAEPRLASISGCWCVWPTGRKWPPSPTGLASLSTVSENLPSPFLSCTHYLYLDRYAGFTCWIPRLPTAPFHFRFWSTMASWTSLWQLPWQSALWWPWSGRGPRNTSRQKEKFGRSLNPMTKWLVMCGRWMTSIRYGDTSGPVGGGEGGGGIKTKAWTPVRHGWPYTGSKCVFCGPTFHRAEFTEVHSALCETRRKFRYCSRDKMTIKKVTLSPKRQIINERVSLFGNRKELEQMIWVRFSVISAGKSVLTFGSHTWSPRTKSVHLMPLVWPPLQESDIAPAQACPLCLQSAGLSSSRVGKASLVTA